MKRTIIFFILISFASQINAQNQAIRDTILGIYFCNVTFISNGNTSYNTDTIRPYADAFDSIGFFIDDGQFCCWSAHMILNNDSAFTATNVISEGVFYAPDSLYYTYNCLSPLGCVYLFHCNKISSPVGVMELKNTNELFSIFPNPSHDLLSVHMSTTLSMLKASIYNIFGQKIFERDFENIDASFEINVANHPRGIYFLKLNDGKNEKIFKVILE